ncbi:hypothetical protein CYY_004799 [Polysphondylium violaceum]|uniref:Ribosomal protein L7/L12 oligomerisation domain-containing protein n=1 Tax=Polysphondylium violaceum TaxID=133409 RepID=A0A8J4PUV2_9MYCE|nr:hypothetical protein CYY_004799 [Polysphondylium violaceum]
MFRSIKCLSTFSRLSQRQTTLYNGARTLCTSTGVEFKILTKEEKDAHDKKIEEFAERICELSTRDVIILTKAIQSKLGLPDIDLSNLGSSAAPAAGAPAAAAAAAPAAAKTEFSVKLIKVADGAKYKIIKELREIKPSLSLMEVSVLHIFI